MNPYLVGPGWWTILDDYLEKAKKIDPSCELDVKEKHGSLRADILTENDDARAALYQIEREMEKATDGVCEVCGAPGKIVGRRSWLTTMCDRCAALDDEALRPIYKDTEERYFRGSYLRHENLNMRKKTDKRLSDFLHDEGYPVGPGWWFLLDDELPVGCDAEIFERNGICFVRFEPFDFEIVNSIESRSACICSNCGSPREMPGQNSLCDRCRQATPHERKAIRDTTANRYLKERTST